LVFTAILMLACGGAATPVPAPTVGASVAATAEPSQTPVPTPEVTAASPVPETKTAKNKMVAVMGVEPPTLFSWPTIDAHPSQMTRSTQL
jgi:hypothetical protein